MLEDSLAGSAEGKAPPLWHNLNYGQIAVVQRFVLA